MAVRVDIIVYNESVTGNIYYPYWQTRYTHFPTNVVGRDTIYLDIKDDTLRHYNTQQQPEVAQGHALLRDHTIGDLHLPEGLTLSFQFRNTIDVRDPVTNQVYQYHAFHLGMATDSFGGTLLGRGTAVAIIPVPNQRVEPPMPIPEGAMYRSASQGRVLQTPVPHSDIPASYLQIPCFARGTPIMTPRGAVAVEALRAGDLVMTRDHGAQPVLWSGGRYLSARILDLQPNLRPVRIAAGALGRQADGTPLPRHDIRLSPQHRVLVRSAIARRIAGADEALVAAKHLSGMSGIAAEAAPEGIGYHHLLLAQHELLSSGGIWTESLYTGPEALRSLTAAARRELTALCPGLFAPDAPLSPAARPFLTGREGRELARRSLKNARPLLDA